MVDELVEKLELLLVELLVGVWFALGCFCRPSSVAGKRWKGANRELGAEIHSGSRFWGSALGLEMVCEAVVVTVFVGFGTFL